jgi:hypothetical protein
MFKENTETKIAKYQYKYSMRRPWYGLSVWGVVEASFLLVVTHIQKLS